MSIRFRNRLLKFICVFIVLILATYYYRHLVIYTPDYAYMTGWICLSLLIFLGLFNARKKLSFLPLGKPYFWSQLHYYLGFLLGGLFILHIDFRYPLGIFESILFYLFILELGSGLFGLFISRAIPKRLAKKGEYVIFERLPSFRYKIKENIEQLVSESINKIHSSAISEFYNNLLLKNLLNPQHYLAHLFNSNAPYNKWILQFENANRYMDENERAVISEIKNLYLKKIDLDYYHANQSLLKLWLFIHIPLSYGLMVFVLTHLLLTHGFMSVPL